MSEPLHTGQLGVLNEANRFNWLSAGRRWRKTSLGVIIASSAAIEGQWILWGAPTFDQVRIGWDMVDALGVADMKVTRNTAYFKGGGKIIFRSLDDPDNMRGHSGDGAIFDEAGLVKEKAYYDIVQPILADTGGWFWGIGTPNGRNWFWREWMASKSREDAVGWQIPTLGCRIDNGRLIREDHPYENPYFSWEELNDRFATTPIDIFKQEYMASFVQNSQAVFSNIEACCTAPDNPHPDAHRNHHIVAGVDFAQTHDWTSVSCGCDTCKQELVLFRIQKHDWSYMRDRMGAIFDRWKPELILAEQNAMGSPNIEEMQRSGYNVRPFNTTASSKPTLIENMVLTLEKQEWQFLNDPVGKNELEAYERKVSLTTGRSSFSAPSGMFDDTVISRALMLTAANRGGVLLAFS